MTRSEHKPLFPLTHPQSRIWYTEMMYPQSDLNQIVVSCETEQAVEFRTLEAVIRHFMNRQDAFRIRLTTVQGQVMQYIENDSREASIEYVKLEAQSGLDDLLSQKEDFQADSADCELYRIYLYELGERRGFIAKFHHLIADGWSSTLFIDYVWNEYIKIMNQEVSNSREQEANHSIADSSYLRYIENEQAYLGSKRFERNEQFWMDTFQSLPDRLPKPSVTIAASRKFFVLDEQQDGCIRNLVQERGLTVPAFFMTVFYLYLSQVEQSRDLTIGTPVFNRSSREERDLFGMCTSTMPVRLNSRPDQLVSELFSVVNAQLTRCYYNQKYPYNLLVPALKRTNAELTRLFDYSLNFLNYRFIPSLNGKPIVTNWHHSGSQEESLTLTIAERHEQRIIVSYDYKTELFTEQDILMIHERMQHIINQVLKPEELMLQDIEIVTPEERQRIDGFNQTSKPYPSEHTLVSLFEEQVDKSPDAIAAVYQDQKLNYRELNAQANRLAYRLRAEGVRAGHVVAIMATRSIDMLTGIYGILKAGAAYLPIDPDYPQERISYMLADSGAQLLICEDEFRSHADAAAKVLPLRDEGNDELPSDNPEPGCGPKDLAYIIYTSGTTGQPKGVMIEHHAVVNRLAWMQSRYSVQAGDVLLQKTPLSFDVSVWELFWWSLYGASVCLLEPGGEKDPDVLMQTIAAQRVTVLHFVPSMLNAWLEALESGTNRANLSSVRRVFTSGEALHKGQVDRFYRFAETSNLEASLVNLYGPTEATVDVTYYDCTPGLALVPIGKPIDNTRLYIVGEQLQLQSIGVPGELCIAGAGLARGYLNRPKLTEMKFVNNPFEEGERMYRTGDLARWLPDGNIEYLGRLDSQVKVRGYRIELGEVEAQLLQVPDILEAAVLVRDDHAGHKQLCGYYVAAKELASSEVRSALADRLPGYMVPAHLIQLQAMPLSPNGKLHRKALPEPETILPSASVNTAPRTPEEKVLVSICSSVLGNPNIGVQDHFFEMGGDSIKVLQVIAKLVHAGYKLEMRDAFDYPTLEQMSRRLKAVSRSADQRQTVGEVIPTPVIARFMEGSGDPPRHYNQSVFLYRQERFDTSVLRQALHKLTAHHDALRMVLKNGESGWRLWNRGTDEGEHYSLEVFDCRESVVVGEMIQERASQLQASIDLENGPLMKLALFQCPDGDHLLIVIHHLAVDGYSWRILLEDLSQAYRQVLQGEEPVLPLKTDSFRKWANLLDNYADTESMRKELPYWLGTERTEVFKLPKDMDETAPLACDTEVVEIAWSREETELLLKNAHRAYNTEVNDLLLTALGMAVSAWSGQSGILIDLEGHGREGIFPDADFSRTVGWFTSIYPVLLLDQPHLSLAQRIKKLKEQLRAIPDKGIGYGILRYLAADDGKGQLRSQPEISFNYLGQFDQDLLGSTLQLKLSPYAGGSMVDGRSVRKYVLDMNGAIRDGCLTMEIGYSSKQYRRVTMDKLAAALRHALSEVLHHCSSKEQGELTPSDLVAKNLSIDELDELQERYGNTGGLENVYPLTPMQKGMLFHSLVNNQPEAFVQQISLTVQGALDIELFRASWNAIMDRHDALRTNFLIRGREEPLQIVFRERELHFHYEDIRELESEKREQHGNEFVMIDRSKGFDLAADPLMRVSVLRKGDTEYQAVWSHHHIVLDGWCLPLLIQEVFMHYSVFCKGGQPELQAGVPYRSYLSWLSGRDAEAAAAYWGSYLQGYEGISSLPQRLEGDRRVGYAAEVLESDIGTNLTNQISAIAKQYGITINTVLQTAWAMVLQKYNGSDDVVFGSIVSGRTAEIPELEKMIGLCINAIPVRVACDNSERISTVMRRVQDQAVDSHAYDYYPLYEIQARTTQGQGLIDHVLVFENYPLADKIGQLGEQRAADLVCRDISIHEQTNYDLNLIALAGESLRLRFLFNGHVYDPAVIAGISASLIHVLYQMALRPEMSVDELELISEQAFACQQASIYIGSTDPHDSQTVHGLFEKQAQRTPDAIAVVADGINMTYRELNERSNRLARVLVQQGVNTDGIVGLMMQRSARYIPYVLAVLKAGGAIMPIDPENPTDRIRRMLDDSRPVLVVSESPVDGAVLGEAAMLLAEEAERASADMRSTNLLLKGKASDAMYVIYTSGSTGVPKGVLQVHRTLLNLLQWQRDSVPLDEGRSKVLQFASMSFDVCYQEIFTALLGGAVLHIIPEELKRHPKALINEIVSNRTDIVFLPTAYLKFIASEKRLLERLSLSCLKHLVVAGEQLVIHPLLRSYLQESGVTLHNHYGPSETHVVTAFVMRGGDSFIPNVPPIGKPIANASIYILDRNGRLLPDGASGELYIGGAGLARGYVNRPELTNERFIPHPVQNGEKIYRTGDLARRLPDGTLEYLGRIDHQVKIRGYRIELGEVESRLLEMNSVTEAVVLALDDKEGGKYLCAYIAAGRELAPELLRRTLSEKLPSYMIPSFFVQLDRMPLTVNGKVDRRALPQPDRETLREKTYKAPRSETERKLAEIWKRILKLQQVSADDHFFHIGGHSLSAASLAGMVSKEMQIELSIQEIFQHPTLERLAEIVESRTPGAYAPIPRADVRRDGYPVSSAQKRIYLACQLASGELSYNMPGGLRIEGAFDLEKANKALRQILHRHEALRTAFLMKNGTIVQQIEKELPLFLIEPIHAPGEEEEAVLRRFIRPFDLAQAPLLRAGLFTMERGRQLLLFDMHHIISDGVSLHLLAQEFAALYQGQELAALPIQYKDYSAWQQSASYRQALEPHRNYWKTVFRDGIPLLELPTDFPRPHVQSFQGGSVIFRVDRILTDELGKLTRQMNVTLFMTLLAAFNVLLSKYSGEQDIVVGSPAAGREHPDAEPLIGIFINTLALRNFPEESKTFREFVTEVGERTLEAFGHQAYPFEELVETLEIPRDLTRSPLFDVMFVFQNTKSVSVSAEGLNIETVEADTGAVKVDLTLTLTEDANGMQGSLTYAAGLFKHETIERMADRFLQLLHTAVREPDMPIKEISIMTKQEKYTLLELFNRTDAVYPATMTIHKLFEKQAERTPNALAVISGEDRLTYAELNARANKVAHKLRSCGVRADSIVGILTERSADMMAGIFGILKAGGAYLPLDPAYPLERIRYMLEDSGTEVLLSGVNGTEWFNGEVVDLRADCIQDQPVHNLEALSGPGDLAYVIYTSGSTGQPKGVMIEHHSVVNRLHWMQKNYRLSEGDIILQKTPISFDVSVWELFWWSWYGAGVCLLAPGGEKDPAQIAAAIAGQRVTVMHFVPPMLGAFLDYLDTYPEAGESLSSLRKVFASGQALPKGLAERFYDRLGRHGVQLVNLYGPTEATVDVSSFDCKPGLDRIPIGKPIDNIRLYVVDRHLRPLPVGIPGELCIAGAGLARGYLGRPELTEEKFVANPMQPGEQMYRTGDIARWLSDGNVEYLGRMDHQVKIRGNRIELGEIEERLLQLEHVREAAVVDRTDEAGASYLAAYVVAQQEIPAYDYRMHLAHSLPSYMIPACFVNMERLPLTPSGKLDRRALPVPGLPHGGAALYAEPETPQEWKLAGIWGEVLGRGQIGVDDPFFQIGGDSIKLIQVANRIHQEFGIQADLKELYTYQTVREFADYMNRHGSSLTNKQLEQGLALVGQFQEQIRKEPALQSYLLRGVSDYYPLSKIQASMVYYSKLKPHEPIYHDQFFFTAAISPFNGEAIQQVTGLLAARHDILRTVFDTVQFPEPVQLVYGKSEPDLTIEDIRHLPVGQQKRHIDDLREQDLADKYLTDDRLLWRLRIFRIGEDEAVILLSFHHAALDGWSVAVFQQEFMELYNRIADQGAAVPSASLELPALRTSYKEYVALNAYKMTDDTTTEYWQNLLSGYTRGKLPFNIARKPLASSVPSAIINRTVNETLVRELEESASRYGCHVRDLCLAAHLYLLRVVTAEKDIVTGVVSHDRPAVQDGERILGCFLNSLPMRMQLDKREEKQALLRRVSDTLYRMKSHEVFLSDIARMIGERSDPALNPIFDILFNYTDFHVLDFASAGDGIRPDEAAGLEMESAEMTNTLLDVEVHRSGHRMNVQIKYAPQYFYEQDMETVFTLYMRILARLSDPDLSYIDSAELMLEAEKAKLLQVWNAPVHELPAAYAEGLTLHALFEEQAVRTPNAPAVRHRGRTLTYAQLESDANRLARHLAARGVRSGDHVALVSGRGCAMITGMLAILKAGAAYVPIDPDYPAGRKAYILQNAEATAVLSDQAYPDLEDFGQERLIPINGAELTGFSSEPLKLDKDSRDLAYIIYTSGSTGTPKGVMIEHRSAVNLVSWVNTRFNVGAHDRLLFVTSMCFDLSVYDIFGILAAGGTIVAAEREEVLDPAALLKLMEDEGVTFWDSVPTTMNHFMHQVEEMLSENTDMRLPAGLRLVFMSGDWIPVTLPGRIRHRFPQAEVISLGGATEGTVWSNYYPIGDVSPFQSSIPYGVPIGGNAFYILDEDKEPVPWGVAGELYIGGVGVARGYRNDEAKTAAAFVPDPFLVGSTMYKTGDLGRLLPDGNMEFLGRKDHQVKIRGYRVELGEIDGRLSRHPGIREAVTIDRQDGREHRYLCAYIVPSDATLTQAEIREYLAAELPSYMVPAAYVWMDQLPLNANGKVDRGQLPEPDGRQETADSFTAPQTPTERKLAGIWKDILKLDRVGAQDQFFEIGGDSLSAASMAGRIQKDLGVAVPLQDIFRLPNLEKLAAFIDRLAPQAYSAIPVIPEQEWYAASPAQEWIYILAQKDGDGEVYNMPSVLEITGEIDPDRIRAVFLKLIDRHETLRTGFEIREQEVVQRVYSEVSFEFEWIPWMPSKNEMLKAIHGFIRPFELSKPPLLRVGLSAKSREEHLMIIDMHHIISDGVSLQIIMNDFLRLYAGEELAPLAVQYKDYAAWQRQRMESELFKEREAYWNQSLSGELLRNDLPIAYPRPAVRSFEGALHTFEIDVPVVEELRRLAASTGSTMYMVLLAAYSVLLSQYSGSEDIVLGTQVAGRTAPELAPMIGMFVNTLPLRNYPRKVLTFREYLLEVRTNTLRALENQDYPFAAMVEKLGMKHEPGRNPVFDYVFAFAETEQGRADIGEISVRPYSMEHHVAKFDMTLTIELEQSLLTGTIEFSTALFSTKAIEGLAGNFTELVRRIAEDPERLLATLQPFRSDKPASSLDNLELMF